MLSKEDNQTLPNIYEVALGITSGIGGVLAQNLLSYCGSAEKVFQTPKSKLLKVPLIGEKLIQTLLQKETLIKAEEELKKVEKLDIQLLFFGHKNYPYRLKEIHQAPVLLYYKGNANLNANKIVSIVGTRKATDYGRDFINQFFQDFKFQDAIIVSGLAYGIDIHAHKESLKYQIPTVGVMANGLDSVYPSSHSHIAKQMLECGGLLSESPIGTKPDAPRFPARNRIIAGLSDALIVVEALEKGGAVISANLANDYNRDVFAVPGSLHQVTSQGCNKLIKTHKAHLIESCKDLAYIMNWDVEVEPQLNLFEHLQTLSKAEQEIIFLLKELKELHIDDICHKLSVSQGEVSVYLLQLEMSNLVISLPGKKYKLSNTIKR